ncbi:MAG: transposase, partial [Gemmatimonadota bacterium]
MSAFGTKVNAPLQSNSRCLLGGEAYGIDSPDGCARYAQRFAAVAPVFATRRANKRLDRFTLRGRRNVETQWTLTCLVHTIDTLAHTGYAASGE